MRVRPLEAGEIGRAREIAAGLVEAPQWPEAAYRQALDAGSSPRRLVLAAERGERLIGFAVAAVVAGEAELESIAVERAVQRAGVGRALLEALVDAARGLGAERFLLEARVSNEPALRLYRALGFVENGRRPRYYRDPEEDAVLMERVLG